MARYLQSNQWRKYADAADAAGELRGTGTILHKHSSWSIFRPGKPTGILRKCPVSGLSRSMRSPVGLAYNFEQIVW